MQMKHLFLAVAVTGVHKMNKNAFVALLMAVVAGFSGSAFADLTVTIGQPLEVFADPSDVVIGLDTAGSCGSKFFHIQRANENFKELTAIVLTAIASGKPLRLFVTSCSGDRNILSHGSVF
jgi:hypothetical protein